MKAKSREILYLNLSRAKKPKRAMEWCMRFLWVDIDSMSDSDFVELVTEYESIVAYPENIGYYHFPGHALAEGATDDEITDLLKRIEIEEEAVRYAFKEYQKKAMELFDRVQQAKNELGTPLKLDMNMSFTIRIRKNHKYEVTDKKETDFGYSYARQIASVLDGKTFDNVFRKCTNCGHYFAVLSNRPKESCSHKCAMLHYNKKIFENDRELARKRGNLESYYSRIRNNNYTDAKTRSLLRFYIKKNNYEPEWISPSINKFLKRKSEK